MKRADVLKRLGFSVAPIKRKRIVIHSDVKCEADDQFAIAHHLLTPSVDVRGIIAAHFEWRYTAFEHFAAYRGTSMEQSYQEARKILDLMELDDVPLYKGMRFPLGHPEVTEGSEGVDFIIEEAMRDDDSPLYLVMIGCLTDLAVAYKKEPRIADRLTVIWSGGACYPAGGDEANIKEDVASARIVFESPMPLWQIPSSTYVTMNISLAELMEKVKPCGDIGEYLCKQMLELNDYYGNIPMRMPFPHGESWHLGDTPTIAVLLQGERDLRWHTEKAPFLNDNFTYTPNPNGRDIRVFDSVDTRLTMEDLFAKLKLCYYPSVR